GASGAGEHLLPAGRPGHLLLRPADALDRRLTDQTTTMRSGNAAMAKRWYIVQAYSNFERKVAEDIRQKVAQKKLDDLFDEVVVPTEKVVEMRRGRKVDAERKFFPGYVLVKMEM